MPTRGARREYERRATPGRLQAAWLAKQKQRLSAEERYRRHVERYTRYNRAKPARRARLGLYATSKYGDNYNTLPARITARFSVGELAEIERCCVEFGTGRSYFIRLALMAAMDPRTLRLPWKPDAPNPFPRLKRRESFSVAVCVDAKTAMWVVQRAHPSGRCDQGKCFHRGGPVRAAVRALIRRLCVYGQR